MEVVLHKLCFLKLQKKQKPGKANEKPPFYLFKNIFFQGPPEWFGEEKVSGVMCPGKEIPVPGILLAHIN